MAYYDALIAKWATLTGTTAQKLSAINALTVMVSAPAHLNVSDIINAITPTDFASLSSLQLQQMQFLLQSSGNVNASPSTTIRAVFQTIFAGKTTTLNNLAALVAPYDSATLPWWQASVAQGGGGLSSPVNGNDLVNAGNLT